MNKLSREATDQAAEDSNAKIAFEYGKPQAALAWLLRQSWKVKFLLSAVMMFLVYVALATFLNLSGVRPARLAQSAQPPVFRCNDPVMSVEERARCTIQRDELAAADREAARQKTAAQYQKATAKKKALDDEINRQRDASLRLTLKTDIDRRLAAIAEASFRFNTRAERVKFFELMQVDLPRLLMLSDHPMSAVRREGFDNNPQYAFVHREADQDPPNARAGLEAIDAACDPIPINRPACAAALSKHMLDLSFRSLRPRVGRYIDYTKVGPE